MIKIQSDTLSYKELRRIHKAMCLVMDVDYSLSIEQKDMLEAHLQER